MRRLVLQLIVVPAILVTDWAATGGAPARAT
jgi:hypothetical protein